MATLKERRAQQNRIAIFGFLAISIVISGFALLYWQNSDVARDQNNCPLSGPQAFTAIILDQSERYSANHIQAVKALFDQWLKGNFTGLHKEFNEKAFSTDAKLELFVMKNSEINSIEGVKPVLSKCIGLRPENVSTTQSIFVNSEFLSEDLEEIVATFDEEITQQMNSPNNPATATSPLMEMIVSVSNSSFLKNDASKPHYMIVVSDMIQESREFSHRRNSTDFKVWEESFRHVRGDLKESKVQLIYLNRNDDKTTQNRKHVIFWEDFFDYLNARIVAVISR